MILPAAIRRQRLHAISLTRGACSVDFKFSVSELMQYGAFWLPKNEPIQFN